MFCTNCGTGNEAGSGFCVSCGNKLVAPTQAAQPATTYAEPKFPTAFSKFFSNKKLLAITGGGLALLLIAAVVVVVNLPKKVAIEVTVLETYGGVFQTNCKVETEAASLVPKFVRIAKKGEVNGVGKVELTYVPSPAGGCVGKGEISLGTHDKYQILNGVEVISQIGPDEFDAGKAISVIHAPLYRDLRVNFDLYDTADSCTGTTESWHCYWDNDWIFGLSLNSSADTCKGQNGYSDVHSGINVYVRGRSSGSSDSATLIGNSYDLESVSTKEIACHFYAEFTGVPNDPMGYDIEVGTRGSVEYDIDGLRSNDWVAEMQLGKD